MITAFLSDIHANLQALQAVLAELERRNVTRIICAGDVVGYGGSPGECIELLREKNIPCCCGNHDCYVAFEDEMPANRVRPEAQEVINWTRKQLSEEQLEWLRELPMTLQADKYMVTHASCQPYPKWVYVTNQLQATLHLLFQNQLLCFNGHCHIPVIASHQKNRQVTLQYLKDSTLPKYAYTMVGVGSVGQPRDEDPRACCILFDTSSYQVKVLRVEYDVESAQLAILKNKLPPTLATRLSTGT